MITVIDRSIDPSIDRLKTEKVIKRYGNRHGLTLVELVALIGPTEWSLHRPTTCFSIVQRFFNDDAGGGKNEEESF